MSKSHFRAARLFGPSASGRRRFIRCKRPILYGERCEDCKRELRQRQARKPR